MRREACNLEEKGLILKYSYQFVVKSHWSSAVYLVIQIFLLREYNSEFDFFLAC